MPTATHARPRAIRARAPHCCTTCDWIHEPAVQVIVAEVRASPAKNGVWPRIRTMARGRNASAPKNPKVMMPRRAIVAGRPRPARRVPRGTRRTSAARPMASAGSAISSPHHVTDVRPASSTPAARAVTMAGASRPRAEAASGSAGGPVTRRSAGTVRTAEMTRNGSRPKKTYRQSKNWATKAAAAGPARPGTTQAVERMANMRGRTSSG